VSLPAGRRWNVDHANASLPGLTALIESLRLAVTRAHAREAADLTIGTDIRVVLYGVTAMLAVDGIVLRDLDRGLIDFPACADSGRDYWLCWVVGEPAVEWWHWPETGFAGRRPITDPPT
jgi:hypothetical protein